MIPIDAHLTCDILDTLTLSLTVSSNERYMTAQFWAIQKTKEKD